VQGLFVLLIVVNIKVIKKLEGRCYFYIVAKTAINGLMSFQTVVD
jgi:hypothetical protein